MPSLDDAQVVAPGKRGADLQVNLVRAQVGEPGHTLHPDGSSADHRMVEGRTVHSKFRLVEHPIREDVHDLEDEIGRTNRLGVPRADLVERPVDERVVDVVTGKHGRVIGKAVVDAARDAVFANRIDTRCLIQVGVGVDRRLTNRPAVEDWLESGRGRQGPVAKRSVRHKSDDRLCKALPDRFVIHEEERAIPGNGPTEIDTELVHAKRRDLRGIEWGTRIQRVIVKELKGRAMKGVRPGLRHGVHLSAPRRAAFGGVDGGFHPKFRNRFQGNVQARIRLLTLLLNAGRIDSIECEVVVVAAPPNEPDVSLAAAAGVDRAWGERLERRPVAAVDRNIFKLLMFENGSYPRIAGFEWRCRGLHLKLF